MKIISIQVERKMKDRSELSFMIAEELEDLADAQLILARQNQLEINVDISDL